MGCAEQVWLMLEFELPSLIPKYALTVDLLPSVYCFKLASLGTRAFRYLLGRLVGNAQKSFWITIPRLITGWNIL